MLHTQPPPAHVRSQVPIAAQAEQLSHLPLAEADALCDEQIACAVKQWRIGDATEWQRVKFRQRWIRAMRLRGAAGEARA